MAYPVYLFTGPEIGERNETINKLRAQYRTQYGSVDEYNLYATDTHIPELVSLLDGQGFFTDATFVVLKNAELIKKKDELDQLAQWIKNSAHGSSALVLVSDEISVDKKLEALVPKEHAKKFWELFENRKQEWVRSFFRKNGLNVNAAAIDAVLDLVPNDTESLRNACQPFFFVFQQGYTVTEADVENVLAHNREESAFTLFDAMADARARPAQRLEKSLEILQSLRLSKDSSGVALIAGLSYSFRQLRAWHTKPGFGSSKQQARYTAAARLWSSSQTLAIIARLAQADIAIRTDGTALEETHLRILLYEIIIKNGEACKLYEDAVA